MQYGNQYNPYMYGGYQPYIPADNLNQLKAQQNQPSPIIWVQGEAAARAYMVSAGNTVLLMDSETSTFYLKSTDASRMPQPLRIFDYTERAAGAQAAEYATKEDLKALEEKLYAMIGGNEK